MKFAEAEGMSVRVLYCENVTLSGGSVEGNEAEEVGMSVHAFIGVSHRLTEHCTPYRRGGFHRHTNVCRFM